MFENTLLFEKKYNRKKPMALAVLFEFCVIAFLIFLPLFLKTGNSKEIVVVEQLFFPPKPPPGTGGKKVEEQKPASPKKEEAMPVKNIPQKKSSPLQSPTEIPPEIIMEKNGGSKNGSGKSGTEAENGIEGETRGGSVPGGLGKSPNENKEKEIKKEKLPPPPPDDPLKMGGNIKQAKLIYKVEPTYPPLAKKSGVQGDVVLKATIGTEGNTHNIKVVSGHPLLRQSSIDAVAQWKYEPATLNGEPIEVETTITVKYILK